MQPCGAFCERCGSPLPLIPCFHVARFLSHFMAPPPSSKKNGKRKADAVLDIDTPASPPAPASTGKDPQRPNPRIGHASDAEAGPSTSARASKKTRLSDKDQLANVTRKLQETEGGVVLHPSLTVDAHVNVYTQRFSSQPETKQTAIASTSRSTVRTRAHVPANSSLDPTASVARMGGPFVVPCSSRITAIFI